MKKCPYCAEEIQDEAQVCRFCNRELEFTLPDAKTSGKAVASLIFSFFSWLFIPGVVAVVLGHIAYSQIKKSAGQLKGKGVAIAGLVLGYGGIAAIPFLLIIAAIAIPSFVKSHIDANEASVVGSLRTLNTAQATYAATYSKGFAPDIASLGPASEGAQPDAHAAGLIDYGLASGEKSAYVFTYTVTERDENGEIVGYTITAKPTAPGSNGVRYFFTDKTGVIRAERNQPATAESPPLQY